MAENKDAFLRDLAEGNLEALEFLLTMNVASMKESGLDPETLMMVRMAVLAAIDAPAVSWVASLGAATETEISLDQVRGVLVAIAPLVGSPKVMSAAGRIREALFSG